MGTKPQVTTTMFRNAVQVMQLPFRIVYKLYRILCTSDTV